MNGVCASCGKTARMVARNLCSSCYLDPNIRAKHPRRKPGVRKHKGGKERFAARGHGLTTGRLPAEPTQEMPGSKGKAKVMRERVARGETPGHPLDARDKDTLPGFDARERADKEIDR